MIRQATADDAPGILQCLRTAFEPYRRFYTAEGFRDTTLDEQTVYERLRTMTVLVATNENAIVGTIAWCRVDAGEAHLRGMAVLPQWQGSAAAKELLEAAESQARAAGCARITLDTTAPLQRAIRFYEKNGYRATGVVGDFFGMPLYQCAKEFTCPAR